MSLNEWILSCDERLVPTLNSDLTDALTHHTETKTPLLSVIPFKSVFESPSKRGGENR